MQVLNKALGRVGGVCARRSYASFAPSVYGPGFVNGYGYGYGFGFGCPGLPHPQLQQHHLLPTQSSSIHHQLHHPSQMMSWVPNWGSATKMKMKTIGKEEEEGEEEAWVGVDTTGLASAFARGTSGVDWSRPDKLSDRAILLLNKCDAALILLDCKYKSRSTFKDIAKKVGKSEVYVTSAILGQRSMSVDDARALVSHLEVDKKLADRVVDLLLEVPMKASVINTLIHSHDPTIYRFYEILQVYGPTLKALIHEKTGKDGVMSSVDCKISVDESGGGGGGGGGGHRPRCDEDQDKPKRLKITFDAAFEPYTSF